MLLVRLAVIIVLCFASCSVASANTLVNKVCSFISADSKVIAAMYQDRVPKEEIVDKIEARHKRHPEMKRLIPAILKILHFLEQVKTNNRALIADPRFVDVVGNTINNRCIKQNGRGWLADKQQPKHPSVTI